MLQKIIDFLLSLFGKHPEPVAPIALPPVVKAPDTGRVMMTELREAIDSQIAKIKLKASTPVEYMLAAAQAIEALHVRESGGANRGKFVELIQETVGSAERESWCMSTVQSCIRYAELKTGIASKLKASEHCLTVYNSAPDSAKHSTAAAGRIVVWRHGTSSNGHTGIVTKVVGANEFNTIEGNTGPESSVNREGDGVYAKTRSPKGSGDMKIVGYLDAF
jgi:hypothetical protein